jgi:hypothetical protein
MRGQIEDGLPDLNHSTDIHLNVGRSRLSILSIALALFLFGAGLFVSLGQHYEVRPVWIFLTSFVPITIGFALTVASLLIFLLSQRLGARTSCEIWSFCCGELLMYLALAQTLSGCLQNFVIAIAAVLGVTPQELALAPDVAREVGELSGRLSGLLLLATGLVWGFVVYVAPVLFLLRIGIPRRGKWLLGAAYVAVLLAVFWISAFPYQIKARSAGQPGTLGGYFVSQFWQPALWIEGAPDLKAMTPHPRDP